MEVRVWIQENYPDGGYGQCEEATKRMVEAFSHLRRVRGHYHCPIWGERAHWWCEEDGQIIDPTAGQFPSKGAGEYVEWDESQPEPTGMCPQCGGHCYDGAGVCSDACAAAYTAYLTGV